MLKKSISGSALVLCTSIASAGAGQAITWTHLWTYAHDHASKGQSSEISAFDPLRRELWVIGGTGLEILGWTAKGVESQMRIDLRDLGVVNSVAIRGGLAAVAIANPVNTQPGIVQFYDVATRSPKGSVIVGANPDMVVFTPDGRRLLVANEGERGPIGSGIDPEGSVSIIRIRDGLAELESTAIFPSDPGQTEALRAQGVRITKDVAANLDLEPEYIAVDDSGDRAVVTLQENNAFAVLDIERGVFTQIRGLGLKNYALRRNWADLSDEPGGLVAFAPPPAGTTVRGLYQPDSVGAYRSDGRTLFVYANEGDARSDGSDEKRASAAPLGVIGALGRLNISVPDSTTSNLVAFGGRSFSIRDIRGRVVHDSGNLLDRKAHEAGIYDDTRSDNKGVEPEGVALSRIGERWIAFIGLERTRHSAVAVFDVTEPEAPEFHGLITKDGDLNPEGLLTFKVDGETFLAVAHEGSHTTTLYQVHGSTR